MIKHTSFFVILLNFSTDDRMWKSIFKLLYMEFYVCVPRNVYGYFGDIYFLRFRFIC